MLRRWAKGAFAIRLRPHYVLGYVALGCAAFHMMLAMPGTSGANGNGLWSASFATIGLGLQAFVGTNLQSPGSYRLILRRYHTALFWAIAFFSVVHVVLNGAVALAAAHVPAPPA
jgi:Ni,Fe-hydrogenase I cytochrome b subunit